MDHRICLDPNGDPIPVDEERSHNLYHMSAAEIRTYDCGSLEHPEFPDQDQRKAFKPLLRNLLELVDEHALLSGVAPPSFNIELKSDSTLYGTYQPGPDEFARLVLGVVDEIGLSDRCILQSFDPAILEVIHKERPEIPLALLVEDNADLETQLARLTFTPAIYSPHFTLANKKVLKALRAMDIELVVWTVNEPADIKRMLDLGVDGIISDYPDRVLTLLEGRE
jgi:glycerophosphoryl diester phosphodiesterase